MNEILSIVLIAPIVLVVGVLIGSIGVGGVLLVPALTYLGGIEIHIAIAACMLSYAFSGIVGATIYARHKSIRWESGLWLCIGAMPGAYLGALVVSVLPARTVTLVIAVFVVLAGINALRNPGDVSEDKRKESKTLLIVIGIVVGIGSALSGTGGPLLLVPLLVWLNWPVLTAIGLSQIIQLPISALATVGNYLHGHVDVMLALSVASVMIIGVTIGARLAHKLPALQLRRIVAVVLSFVGMLMLWKTF